MQARDISVKRVLYLEPGDNLAEARRIFVTTKATKIPVFDGGSLVGSVTELELVRAYAIRRGPIEDVLVSDVMSKEIDVVGPSSSLDEVIQKLCKTPFLVVMDSEGFYGIITKTNALEAALPLYQGSKNVADLMTRDVMTIKPDQSIFKAAKIMFENKIKHLPVMGVSEVDGLVSAKDIALSTFGLRPDKVVYTRRSDEGPRRAVKIVPHTVGSLMHSPVLTIKKNSGIRKAAKVMLANGVGSLLVVEGGEMQGIITKTDILLALERGL